MKVPSSRHSRAPPRSPQPDTASSIATPPFGIGIQSKSRSESIENQGSDHRPPTSLKECRPCLQRVTGREGRPDRPLVRPFKGAVRSHVLKSGPGPWNRFFLTFWGQNDLPSESARACRSVRRGPRASRFLRESGDHSNEQKRRRLPSTDAERSGASAVDRSAMQILRTGAGAALSWTGFAGPDGGTREDPVGTVWIACAIRGKATEARRFHFPGSRERVRMRAAYTGFDMLRRLLLEP